MLSYTLAPKLIEQMRKIHNDFIIIHNTINTYSDDTRLAMHRYAYISMIGASTRIENALLTDPEIEWLDTLLTQDGKPTAFSEKKALIEDKLSKDRERSIEEVAGCRNMLGLIYEQAAEFRPLSETIICGLHYELMRYYQKAGPYIGRYKVQPNSVVETNHLTGEMRTVFKTADAGPITEAAMQNLTNWYKEAILIEAWPVAIACEFTYRFLAIHPFQDGNGRLGRGLFLLALLQAPDLAIASVTPYLAIDRQIEKHKIQYYHVLNRCSNGIYQPDETKYHIEYFLEFMLNMLQLALNDIEINKRRFEAYEHLSAAAQLVLSCFKDKPEVRLTSGQLTEITNLPKRTINNCLTTLLRENLIQRYGRAAGIRYQLIF